MTDLARASFGDDPHAAGRAAELTHHVAWLIKALQSGDRGQLLEKRRRRWRASLARRLGMLLTLQTVWMRAEDVDWGWQRMCQFANCTLSVGGKENGVLNVQHLKGSIGS